MSDHVLAIDPGSKTVGWARFLKKKLVGCGVLRAETPVAMRVQFESHAWPFSNTPVRVYVERPQVYTRSRQKGDQNDLVHIAMIGGMLAGAVAFPADIHFVFPATWKGQAPKKVMGRRILKRLGLSELHYVEAAATTKLAHNAVDAVGLGLWAEGRL